VNAKRILRPLALGLVSVAVAAMGVVTAGAANAATGTLTISPATGNDLTSMTLGTPQACSAGTNVQASVTGSGFPAAGFNVTPNSSIPSLTTNANGGVDIPLQNTMASFAAAQTPPATLAGQYDFTLVCKNAFGAAVFDTFTGSITYDAAKNYTVVGAGATAAATSTTLAATPASPQVAGTNVTLTATVANTTTPATTPVGSVQFVDGTANLGAPVAVTGAGTATLATTALAVGTHSLTAVFIPTSTANFTGSTSAAVLYVINSAGGGATTTPTSLTASASSVTSGSSVTFTATVSPTTAVGSVNFVEGTTTLGSGTVSGGVATFSTSTLAVGSHSVVATFVPTNAANFTVSSSSAVSVTVTTAGGGGTTSSQNITTSVPAVGALSISSAAQTVSLPAVSLNAAGTLLTTSGTLNDVTVTDTRNTAPGFSVTGQVTDFAGPGTAAINGFNLGWTPSVKSASGPTVTAGPAVAPAPGIAPGANPTDPAQGLKTSRTLATGTGTGTAVLSAGLALNAPTSQAPGAYSAVLTLTAI
jgi:hypothetical protein